MADNANKLAIDDDGEFIPGAVKHDFGRVPANVEKANKPDRITLRSLWPEPDWFEYANKKENPITTVTFFCVYHTVRKSPRNNDRSYSSDILAEHYKSGIELLRSLFELAHSKPHTVVNMEKLRTVWLNQLGFPENAISDKRYSIDDMLPALAIGPGKGRIWRLPTAINFYYAELCKHAVSFGFPSNRNALSYCYFPLKFSKAYYICEVKNNRWRRIEDQAFSSASEAIPVAIELNERDFKKEPITKRGEEEPGFFFSKARKELFIHSPGRLKRDLTTGDHLKFFGLRGIQFGNSMPVSERQKWLNNVGLAYLDLASALQLEKSEYHLLSVGNLAVAFGARGRSKAAAHYEKNLNVINLTRKNGPGSIAHEWMHALDCKMYDLIFGKGSTSKFSYLSYRDYRVSALKHHSLYDFIQRFERLMDLLTGSNFYAQALRIEAQKGAKKGYWTSPVELLARAFESYIEDKLVKLGKRNDWLVCETISPHLPVGHEDKNPYPEGAEREKFYEMFEQLMPGMKQALRALD